MAQRGGGGEPAAGRRRRAPQQRLKRACSACAMCSATPYAWRTPTPESWAGTLGTGACQAAGRAAPRGAARKAPWGGRRNLEGAPCWRTKHPGILETCRPPQQAIALAEAPQSHKSAARAGRGPQGSHPSRSAHASPWAPCRPIRLCTTYNTHCCLLRRCSATTADAQGIRSRLRSFWTSPPWTVCAAVNGTAIWVS